MSNAVPIQIALGQTLAPIYLETQGFPPVYGDVTDSEDGLPVLGTAHLMSLTQGVWQRASTANGGSFRFAHVRPGLYVLAIASNQHIDQAFPDAVCTTEPSSMPVCPEAQPVVVGQAAQGYRFDFALDRSAAITGALRIEGGLIQNAYSLDVRLVKAGGINVSGLLSLEHGNYVLRDIVPGTYRVVARAGFTVHAQVFPGRDCLGAACDNPTMGDWVVVGPQTTSGIDFDLRLAQGAKGRVFDAISGAPLSGIAIDVWSDLTQPQFADPR